MGEGRPPLSEAELDVLKVLWEAGPGTVRQINAELARRGKQWAYTTVQTLLQRLQVKGWAASATEAVPHVFRAAASRQDWLRDRLQNLADAVGEGSPTPLVLALVQGHRFSADEIARFRALLDRLEGEEQPASSGE